MAVAAGLPCSPVTPSPAGPGRHSGSPAPPVLRLANVSGGRWRPEGLKGRGSRGPSRGRAAHPNFRQPRDHGSELLFREFASLRWLGPPVRQEMPGNLSTVPHAQSPPAPLSSLQTRPGRGLAEQATRRSSPPAKAMSTPPLARHARKRGRPAERRGTRTSGLQLPEDASQAHDDELVQQGRINTRQTKKSVSPTRFRGTNVLHAVDVRLLHANVEQPPAAHKAR